MNLDTNNWKEFQMRSLFFVDTGGDMDPLEQEEGTIPVICLGFENNGVCMHIKKTPKHTLYKGNSITCAGWAGGLKAFYQEEDFYVKGRVKICKPKFNNNKNISSFLCSMINKNSYLFSYGRKASGDKFLNITLQLPIQHNEDGTPKIDETHKYSEEGYIPDWQFMEDYIKSLHYQPITTSNKKGQVSNLQINTWQYFEIGHLFTIIRGKRLIADDREDGDLPYFSASQDNNGCTDHISNPLFVEKDALIYDTFGDAYYVEGEFTASDEVSIFHNNNLNKYNGLFIATILTKNKYKYAFGRKAFQNKYIDELIGLPIQHNEDGTPKIDETHKYSEDGYIPDWQFMEDYIKSLPYGDRI